ncbi:DUF805 domain-containing protein [Kordia algicida OT-1]|uniref:Aminopeptidase C, putative n=1 Tax=Kordia algicida OT-1 TaxID=391587 RepID=A9E1L8_9FLAO|nr:DUF805 domain-containing protein [Kordia algicida]EDP95645.1 aminopeptidase C, putative [Kordia algicida OT-1]
MEWYLKVVRDNYANFEGRARRQEYWMFVLFNFLIIIGLYVIVGILAIMSESLMALGAILVIIYALGVLIPSIAVVVRRLHDTGNSGWMYLISFIPLIGPIWLLVLMCTEGQVGPNQYGPDPKAAYTDDLNNIGPKSNY